MIDDLEVAEEIACRAKFSNRDLISLFIPLVIEQGLTYIMGFSDTIMVAFVGEYALSGVSLIDFIMALIISIFVALSTGGAIIVGQYLGKKSFELAANAAGQTIKFMLLLSIIFTIAIYTFSDDVIWLLFGTIEDDVYRAAATYLTFIAASIPALALYNTGAAIYRSIGNSRLPMNIMLAMNTLNVIGNAVLIFGFEMGVNGIAIPTLISRVGAASIIMYLLFFKLKQLDMKAQTRPGFDWKMLKRILGLGVPYGFENSLFFLGRLIILSIISVFGTAAIAANSVANTLVLFEILPGMAISLGLTVIISRCAGAEDFAQAKYYAGKIIKIVYVANLVSCCFMLLILPIILNLYNLSGEAAEMVNLIMYLYAGVTIFIWPFACTLPVVFRAAGDVRFAMIVSVSSMLFCRIGFAYILCNHFGFGMIGAWIAQFIDWFIKSLFYVWRFLNEKWMNFKVI